MTRKQMTLSITGFLAAVAFGYVGTQIFGAKVTTTVGLGAIATGGVLKIKTQRKPNSTTQNVPDL
ncbi:hypothetical protein [Nodularia sp. NIES-3585]|uniref:hypothetical protein n=1 Tax=Nodularia sp. NIES-3585 TaxID=1973477 RepID=UPI000B5C8E4F|nr:hypothetical protein [Nodularia sp. NIES-3585]GAX38861.1 hypothetical protein NIES3585_49130 [Nodularia sp. NIES-3585]